MTTASLLNPAYKDWLGSETNPYETILLLEKAEVSEVDLSDISDALEEYVRLFKAEIASPAEILTLSRAYPDEEKYSLAVIDKELDQKEPVVIGGPASVEVVDREGHIITVDAMKRAFDRFMENFRTRNAMVLHSDVQVGWALPAYISKTGKIYKSGVTGDHLFFITELRSDTKIAKKVLEQIETGKMKSYSIAGSATSVEPSKRDGGVVMQVNDMELAEVTICEQGVNQRAKFELMKSDTDRPTSSCVDGSCLIKSQEHKHSETEIFMNSNGEIDTVGSFLNWTQKSMYDDPEDRQTPEQASAIRAENRRRVKEEQDEEEPQGKEILEMKKTSLEQLDDYLVEKGIGDIARGAGKAVGAAVEGVKNVGREFKSGVESAKPRTAGEAAARMKPPSLGSQRIGGADFSSRTKPQYSSKPTPRGKAGVDPNVTLRPGDAAGQARFKGVAEQLGRDQAKRAAAGDPKAQAALKRTQATKSRIADKKAAKQRFPKETDLRGRKEDFEPGGKFYGRKKTPDEIEWHSGMQKSHLEGCLCDSCKQRTGDTNGDDTPRMATDRHGRPTLGHTGHGNVVSILISRMHRKGDIVPFESKDDKETRETVEKTRRVSYNYIAANPNTFPDHHKNTDFSKPYDPETDPGLKQAIQHHQQAPKKTDSDGDKPTMNMAKAVYTFIHKIAPYSPTGKRQFAPQDTPKPPEAPGTAPGNATGVPENPGQKISEAKKKDEATGQTAPTPPKPPEGKKPGWFGELVRAGVDIAEARHGRAPQNPTMNMEKDVKSLAGGSAWKQHKQGVPRASQRKMRQGWDQQSGVGGSNQAIGFREMSEK